MAMAVVSFFFVIGSLRTNIVLVGLLTFVDLTFIMLMAQYWTLAEGKVDLASKCQKVSILSALLSCKIQMKMSED